MKPDAAKADAEAAAPSAAVVTVTALQPARRRIGRAFGPEPVAIPLDALSEAELAALCADPLLRVELPHGDA